jgi:hypothetical protein
VQYSSSSSSSVGGCGGVDDSDSDSNSNSDSDCRGRKPNYGDGGDGEVSSRYSYSSSQPIIPNHLGGGYSGAYGGGSRQGGHSSTYHSGGGMRGHDDEYGEGKQSQLAVSVAAMSSKQWERTTSGAVCVHTRVCARACAAFMRVWCG